MGDQGLTRREFVQTGTMAAAALAVGVAAPGPRLARKEDGLTPPDVMFPKDRITSSCANCHKSDVLQKDSAHEPLLAGKAAEPFKYCTDCHGKHEMAHRTRRWDKVTGKLIEDDGVRMVSHPTAKE